MADIEDRLSIIGDYLGSNLGITDEDLKFMDNAVNFLHQPSPLDGAGVYTRAERLTTISDNLSWLITMIQNRRVQKESALKKLKDPQFTLLVRQGRPSTQAIEAEIRWSNEEVAKLEEVLSTVDNILGYLNSISNNLDRYLWILREKAKFVNK